MNSQYPGKHNRAASAATFALFAITTIAPAEEPFPSPRHWTPGQAGKGIDMG
jgi:hypothetical protein